MLDINIENAENDEYVLTFNREDLVKMYGGFNELWHLGRDEEEKQYWFENFMMLHFAIGKTYTPRYDA